MDITNEEINEKFKIIDIKDDGRRKIALLATENNYIVAMGFDEYFNDWDHGEYFNHFGENKAYYLNKATDFFMLKTDEHYMGRKRLEELATLFKDGLFEDDEDEALTYFDEICEMTESEKDFFGIDYIKEGGDENYE